jgi:hypothetical protein
LDCSAQRKRWRDGSCLLQDSSGVLETIWGPAYLPGPPSIRIVILNQSVQLNENMGVKTYQRDDRAAVISYHLKHETREPAGSNFTKVFSSNLANRFGEVGLRP